VPATAGTFNAYFKDFYRSYRRNGSITIKGRWELGYGDDNCAQCHKSGSSPSSPCADGEHGRAAGLLPSMSGS